MNKLQKDFTTGNIPQQLLDFSTPLFFSSLLQLFYNMADMIIVGQFCGSVGLAAVAVGSDVTNFLTFIAIGFSSAGQVIIAQYLGAGQKENISKFVTTMAIFMLGLALVLSAGSLTCLDYMLQLMHTPAESYLDTYSYGCITMSGLVFIYGYNMLSAILRGLGDSKHPFIFISMASLLNVLLDLLFIAKLDYGPVGAAWATIISQSISFLTCLIFLQAHRQELGMEGRVPFCIDKDMLKTFMALGIPMAVKVGSVHITKLFVNSWINSFGVTVAAVAGIANKLNSVCGLVANSVNTAGASMIGQNIGAEKYARVPKIMAYTFGFASAFLIVYGLALWCFPHQIFSIFTNQEEVIAVAMEYVPYGLMTFGGAAVRAPMNSLINGSGNSAMNFLTAILDGFIMRLGGAVLFGLILQGGYTGFWLADGIAGYTPLFIGGYFLLSGDWKTNKYIVKNQRAKGTR